MPGNQTPSGPQSIISGSMDEDFWSFISNYKLHGNVLSSGGVVNPGLLNLRNQLTALHHTCISLFICCHVYSECFTYLWYKSDYTCSLKGYINLAKSLSALSTVTEYNIQCNWQFIRHWGCLLNWQVVSCNFFRC